MTASNIFDGHYFLLEHPGLSENAADSLAPGDTQPRSTPTPPALHEPMRPDSYGVGRSLGTIQEMSHSLAPLSPAFSLKECEADIIQNYKSTEKNIHRHGGASRFQAYLEGQNKFLADVTRGDLETWALSPIVSGKGKGTLPSEQTFEGAKGLCAFAAEVGYIDAPRAQEIAECTRQHIEVNALRSMLQNPGLTREERESHILLNHQSGQKNPNRQVGASFFLTYLERKAKPLAEVTANDLKEWALWPLSTTHGQSNTPNAQQFDGAKGLCVLAAQVGHIDAQRADDLVACTRPQLDLGTLRLVLQNPALTLKDRENFIYRTYQRTDKESNRVAGASGLLAFLERQDRSLGEVSSKDLEQWALTPVVRSKGVGNLPTARAFDGAKGLCALAAEVGYIDAQRAKDIAECKRLHYDAGLLRQTLQNPALTSKERENLIRLSCNSLEKNPNHQAGANGFHAYLKRAEIPLAEVSISDLEAWALSPIITGRGKRNVPNMESFEGAKAFCALAAEVGHIDAQRAKDLATCKRPHFDVESLRTVLQNPALTPRERDYHIHLSYQSLEKNTHCLAGANGLLAFLESQAKSLSELTTSDLKRWAFTAIATGRGQGKLPHALSFEGAKALCALAAEVGHIDVQTAHDIAECPRPQGDPVSLRLLLQNPVLTLREREHQIWLNFQSAENNPVRRAGASGFLSFLERQNTSLAAASTSELQEWALTPLLEGKGKNNLPNGQAFNGAKALCALAAEVGHMDVDRAQEIARCPRPHFERDFLRSLLQNPALTSKEREYEIRLHLQSSEKDRQLHFGANRFLVYLEARSSSLAEVTKSDLEEWALTPSTTYQGKGALPNPRAFEGAKRLCALAADVGYIDRHRAKEIADCPRPYFDVDFLRSILDNPELTGKDREYHIRLNYQSTEKNVHRQAGANAILAYLQDRGSTLAQVTKSDLEQWALTQIPFGLGKGTYPSARAFEGAQALCALAAEVGHIDAQRAPGLAECTYPQRASLVMSTLTRSESGKRRFEHTDDQAASNSRSQSLALPPTPHASSSQTDSTQTLIDELEVLSNTRDATMEYFSQRIQVKATIARLRAYEPESLQQAKAALVRRNPSAGLRLLGLEAEVANSWSGPRADG